MSQFPPGPPPQGPGGPPPGNPPEPGWGGQQPPTNPPGFPPQQPQQPQPGYGQPSQPGYGQQPYPPAMPPANSGGGGGAKILIILGVVAVLGVGAFFAFGGDDNGGSGSSSSPKGAVEAFFAASKDGDCEKLIGLITESSWNDGGDTSREDALKECDEESQGEGAFPADTKVSDIKTVSEEESSATVNATVSTGGETLELAFPLVKEDGGWRIELEAIGPASETGGEIPGDGGDLPDGSDDEDGFDTDTTLPDLDDLPELPDIPECDYESDEFDPTVCAEEMGG